ncbi:MAG: zinc-ribbon domain-containing protein [Myxococcota bacterium]
MARQRRSKIRKPVAPDPEYCDYVPHPRYGQGPRITGLNPDSRAPVKPGEPFVKLHWHSGPSKRVPNTAVEADPSRQTFSTMGVTHYFDSKRTCRDCGRPFLFFALEQKHWYEELGFHIEADCDRCVPCRRARQAIDRHRKRYETLQTVEPRTPQQDLELAESCVALVEARVFGERQTERVRMLLKRLPPKSARRLLRQVEAIEAKPGSGDA